ncbi:Reverse transcriptase zinc-binding domain [Sesbania bispinosa]|nr:Reverse transcriptase zinc-binding domain [Sesbania bispinosa]
MSGLEIRDARQTNTALLGKLTWKILHDQDSFWVKVLTHKYLKDQSILSANISPSDSFVWKGIIKVKNKLKQGFMMDFHRGDISIWYKDWMGMRPLCNLLPFVHIADTQRIIKELWHDGGWDFSKLYKVLPEVIQSYICTIPIPPTASDDLDTWSWWVSADRKYSSRSGYLWLQELNGAMPRPGPWSWLWCIKAHEKVRFLLWLLLHNSLPTRTLLKDRNIAPDATCSCCNSYEESALHCLRDYDSSREV